MTFLQHEDDIGLFSLFPKTLTVMAYIHLFVVFIVLWFYLKDLYNRIKIKKNK